MVDPIFNEEFLKKLEYLYIVARKVYAGRARAERRTKKVGSGLEFADHRDYSAGDDLRYLDWNIYGRLEKLLLKLYEEEEDLLITILVDVSRSMRLGANAKLDYARRVAAALAYIGLANLDRVSVGMMDEEVHSLLAPLRGKAQVFKIFEYLSDLPAPRATNLGQCLGRFVHRSTRKGMVVVISDLYDEDGIKEGVDLLKYHRYDPVVIQLFDERELDISHMGELSLVDAETGEVKQAVVTPRMVERYKKAFEAFASRIDRHLTDRGVPYFRTGTAIPFDELVLTIFRRGGFLK